jgi:ketosteroid isomerase-like protein
MSSANVELVRSIYASWEHGEFGSAEWADPDLEFVRVDGPAPGTWRGSEAAAGVREMLSACDDSRLALEECRELGADRVLAFATGTARGKRSGVELRLAATNVFDIANGRVTRVITYHDRDRALAELGLAPGESSSPPL